MAITVTHDHVPPIDSPRPAVAVQPPHVSWKALAPIVLALVLALIPPPEGLAPHAWYFFAIFAGVILGLMLEPLPGGAIGLIGVTVVTVLSQFVLFAPAELAKPGFKAYNAALTWALSGFCQHHGVADLRRRSCSRSATRRRGSASGSRCCSSRRWAGARLRSATPSWSRTRCSRRSRRRTPRASGGTIYPVIRNLPALYDSKPNDPSSRRIGSYIMWVAIATTCVTSSLFLTGLAPNLLAIEMVNKTAKVSLTWTQWFVAFVPIGILLLVADSARHLLAVSAGQ